MEDGKRTENRGLREDLLCIYEKINFSDPAVQALQFLDVIGMKDPSQKAQFFRVTLTQVFPFIPRVNQV